jgi:hypothetical protein
MAGNPEVINLFFELVPTNALVLTEPINSETIVRSCGRPRVETPSTVRLHRNGARGEESASHFWRNHTAQIRTSGSVRGDFTRYDVYRAVETAERKSA